MGKRIRNLFYGAGTISIIPRPSTAMEELDALNQRLLDAAIVYQATWQSDDAAIEAWASRLADDVKDAGD